MPVATARQTGKQYDSTVVARMIAAAETHFEQSAYDSAMQYARQAVSYSGQHQYLYGKAWGLIKLIDIFIEKDDLQEAEKHIPLLHQAGMQMKDSIVIAISWLHRAQVMLYSDQLDSAILYFGKALTGPLEKARINYTALAWNDLGYTWGRKEEIDKMTDHCLKALTIYESIDDPVGCAMALGNISTVYYNLGQKQKAIEYGKKSLLYREKAGDIDKLSLCCCNLSQYYLGVDLEEAAHYQQLCVKYALQSRNEDRLIHSYITSSLVANGRKNNQEAFEYELKTIGLLEQSGTNPVMLSRRYIAAAFYTDMLKMDSSSTLEYFNKSINLSRRLNNKANLRDAYLFMSDYYVKKKDFIQGYKYYKTHSLYRDSISLAEREENIDELEKQYETAKKDNEIQQLYATQRIRQLEIEKQKSIINGNQLEAKQKENEISLLIQQSQLQDLKLRQQEAALQGQQLQAKNKEQQLQLAQKEQQLNQQALRNHRQFRNALIAGFILLMLVAGFAFSRYQLKKKLEQQTVLQEMRNNIASDLHDDIGASLSNINILNELTRRNAGDPGKVKEYLGKASEDIKHVSEGIGDIVWNINPRYDNLENLFIRMKRYASDLLDGKDINYNIDFPAEAGHWTLDMDKRRDLYLLFKEAINNLAKYSGADKAHISLAKERNNIVLVVEDNGRGFQKEAVTGGNGLHNMRQRAALLHARLDIASAPGQGTRIHLEVPV